MFVSCKWITYYKKKYMDCNWMKSITTSDRDLTVDIIMALFHENFPMKIRSC